MLKIVKGLHCIISLNIKCIFIPLLWYILKLLFPQGRCPALDICIYPPLFTSSLGVVVKFIEDIARWRKNKRVVKTMFYEQSKMLFLTRENNIRIFKPTSNFFFIIWIIWGKSRGYTTSYPQSTPNATPMNCATKTTSCYLNVALKGLKNPFFQQWHSPFRGNFVCITSFRTCRLIIILYYIILYYIS